MTVMIGIDPQKAPRTAVVIEARVLRVASRASTMGVARSWAATVRGSAVGADARGLGYLLASSSWPQARSVLTCDGAPMCTLALRTSTSTRETVVRSAGLRCGVEGW